MPNFLGALFAAQLVPKMLLFTALVAVLLLSHIPSSFGQTGKDEIVSVSGSFAKTCP